jgi:hypothetical protein
MPLLALAITGYAGIYIYRNLGSSLTAIAGAMTRLALTLQRHLLHRGTDVLIEHRHQRFDAIGGVGNRQIAHAVCAAGAGDHRLRRHLYLPQSRFQPDGDCRGDDLRASLCNATCCTEALMSSLSIATSALMR